VGASLEPEQETLEEYQLHYRERRRLYYLILRGCIKKVTASQIQASSFIQLTNVRVLLRELTKRQLLKRIEERIVNSSTRINGLHVYYKTTPKGKRYIEVYTQILDCLKGFRENE
jgi:predicted transcriptional regulator